jgi:hypothetical protein
LASPLPIESSLPVCSFVIGGKKPGGQPGAKKGKQEQVLQTNRNWEKQLHSIIQRDATEEQKKYWNDRMQYRVERNYLPWAKLVTSSPNSNDGGPNSIPWVKTASDYMVTTCCTRFSPLLHIHMSIYLTAEIV